MNSWNLTLAALVVIMIVLAGALGRAMWNRRDR